MKNPLSFLLVALLAFGISSCGGPSNVKPVDVDPSSVAAEDDYVFMELSDGTYEIAAKANFDKSVVRIPSSHKGKDVTAIAKEGFANRNSIQVISVPGTVTTIKEKAFYGVDPCHVFMDEGVKTVENIAFGTVWRDGDCNWPVMCDFYMPSTIESFPAVEEALNTRFFFADDLSSGTKEGYPNMLSLQNGRERALYGVSHDDNGFLYQPYRDGYRVVGFVGAAKELTFPSTFKGKPVKTVNMPFQFDDAFLEKITLPSTLTEFHAQYIDAPLKQFVINDGIESFSAKLDYGSNAMLATSTKDGGIYIGNDANPYLVFLGVDGQTRETQTVVEGCRIICGRINSSPSKMKGTRKLVLPSTLRGIGKFAFAYETFEEVEFPKSENLKTINQYAFAYCNGIKNVHIPYVETIESYAFAGCGKDADTPYFRIDSFQVDKGLRKLDYLSNPNPANGGVLIQKLVVPSTLVECDASWLQSMIRGQAELTIENGNGYLHANDGTRLALLDYSGGSILPCRFCYFGGSYPEDAEIDIPEGVTHVDFPNYTSAKYKSLILADTVVHYYPARTNKATVTPSHSNPNYAFYAARGYKDNPIPTGTEILASSAMSGIAEPVEILTIPQSVKAIGTGAFTGCLKPVRPIDIPSSVTRIEIAAFGYNGKALPCALRVHGDMSGYADDWCPMGASLIVE